MDDVECGVAKTLKIIGSKWTMLIIRDLCEGKKRFKELERSLGSISPRTLSARLKELEAHGVVNRKVFAEVPLHVEYSLTQKGQSLRGIINLMRQWGQTN